MRSSDDRLFRRWCQRADSRALAALFDRCAPRLLKLARHLAGEQGEAEDLVQATFLAPIEQREQLDTERPVWPWLVGVLENKVRDGLRRRRRALDADQLVQNASPDASSVLEQRELSTELVRAIDALGEPYRQPLLLRLRHDLPIASIAHVLGRSPSAVRVQLHRGRERLRSTLSRGLVGSMALALVPPARGMGAVRARVLSESLSVAGVTTHSSPYLFGMLLMNSKWLAASVLGLLAAALWWQAPKSVEPDAEAALALGSEREAQTPHITASDATTDANRRSVARGPEGLLPSTLHGRVLDAETGLPLANVDVALHLARRASLLEAARDRPHLWMVNADGTLRARSGGDWPRVELPEPGARFGSASAVLYDDVGPDATPVETVLTNARGEFWFASQAGGLIVCDLEGYARRICAAHDSGREWDLSLGRLRQVRGVVTMRDGRPPGVPLTLALSGLKFPAMTMTPSEGRAVPAIIEPEDIEVLGTWRAEVNPDGTFVANVTGGKLRVGVLTLGWKFQSQRNWNSSTTDLRIVVQPAPVLRFLDATNRAPVERVRLLGRDALIGFVHWSGEFDAEDGRLELPGDGFALVNWNDRPQSFSVWAQGYRETRFEVDDLLSPREYEVLLERGTTPEIRGVVRRAGLPASTAQVALVGAGLLGNRREEDRLVDACEVDDSGGFRLGAAAGKYLLRVDHEGDRYLESIELPMQGLFELDLDRTSALRIVLVDELDVPRAQQRVVMQGADGVKLLEETDEQGVLVFDNLSPQSYQLFTSNSSSGGSLVGGLLEPVTLSRGEQRELRAVVRRLDGPQRVTVLGAGSDWEWRASGRAWSTLRPAEPVELTRSPPAWVFEVQAPDGRRWSRRLDQGLSEFSLATSAGGGEYAGRVVGESPDSFAGWRLYARELEHGYNQPVPSVIVGPQGWFRIGGLASRVHTLALHPPGEDRRTYDFSVGELTFRPNMAAGSARDLVIDLSAPAQDVRFSGVVLSAADRAPIADTLLVVESYRQGPHGRLVRQRVTGRSGPDGKFWVSVPAGFTRTVTVYETWSEDGVIHKQDYPADVGPEPLEILVESAD